MADVTRWEMRYPISVHGENPWGPLPSPDGGWVTAADHLAALERVRVETLRALWDDLDGTAEVFVIDAVRGPWIRVRDIRRALERISPGVTDRLINAATTGVAG